MKILSVTILSLSLFACGGGGGSDATTQPTQTPPPAPVMPAGLWVGNVTANNISYAAFGIIAPSGEARFITEDGEQESMTLTLNGSKFTGAGVGFDYQGEKLGAVSIAGDYTATTITGSATVDGQQTSTFSFELSSNSNEGASFDVIKGNYVDSEQTAAISIDVDGIITGSDNDGCQYNGNVKIPDATINVYELTIEVASCLYAGNYKGLATYTKPFDDSLNKEFIFQVDNSEIAITDYLTKQ